MDKTTGQDLIARWMAFVRTYVHLTEPQALVVALWAVNTWVYDTFHAVPFLEIVAPTKRSGKTTLLDVLQMLTRGAEKFAIVRVLTVLRMIEAYEGRITVLIDEAEQFSKPALGEIRSGVATGYKAGAQHAISVGKGFQRFRTFAPWAFAQIGNLHDVLRDRCIEIELERGRPDRILSEHDAAAHVAAQALVGDLVAYSREAGRIPIVAADWLAGRERELWTPLVSVATWLRLHADTMRMLQAASIDFGLLKTLPAKKWHSAQDETDAEDRDMASLVLRDAVAVLTGAETFVPSAMLIDRLRAIPTAPWRAWRGAGLNEITLGALLRRYGVSSEDARVSTTASGRKGRKESKVLKGYKAAALRAALAREAGI